MVVINQEVNKDIDPIQQEIDGLFLENKKLIREYDKTHDSTLIKKARKNQDRLYELIL